jgi:hypothetical protein
MEFNKKLIDQLSDLSRNIKSLTSEVKEGKNSVLSETQISQKDSISDQNDNFLKSLQGIFEKGIDGISKENLKSNDVLKSVLKSTKDANPLPSGSLKLPKELESILGKIPKFEKGGTMEKDGVAIVGEEGPEIVKLNKGDKVIPSEKLGIDALKESLEKSSIKTADQTLNPLSKKIPEREETETKENTINPSSAVIGGESTKSGPESLEEIIKGLENSKIKEDEQKLNKSAPLKDVKEFEDITIEPKKEEKEKSRKKKAEDLLRGKESKKEEKEKSRKKKTEDLLRGKESKKENTGKILDEGKNLLLSKGKDFLSGKIPLSEKLNPSSLLGNNSELGKKGIELGSSFLKKGLEEKKLEKLNPFSKKEEDKKSSMNVESPELKKPKPEIKKEPEESKEIKEIPKKETTKREEAEKKEKEETKDNKEIVKTETKKDNGGKGIDNSDIKDIKSLLARMVNILQGPLSIETTDSPFRPDSRRF